MEILKMLYIIGERNGSLDDLVVKWRNIRTSR